MRGAAYAPPPPAPLGLGGIMSAALAMYRARPLALIVISLVSTLPSVVLATAGDLTYGVPVENSDKLLRGLIDAVPSLLLGQVSVAAAALLVMELLNGRPGSAGHALEVVGLRFWPLAAVIGVTIVAVAAGFVLLVVPAIVIAVLWLYGPIVSVAEGRGLRDSLTRSVALTKGAFWWTLGSYLAIQITVALAGLVMGAILGAPFSSLSTDAQIIPLGVVDLIVMTVVQPVALLGVGLMYADRRVQREGLWPSPGTAPLG